jgi:hypothetical protein
MRDTVGGETPNIRVICAAVRSLPMKEFFATLLT